VALDAKAANARRKKIAKSWWNHDWLSRQLALVHFLAAGEGDGSEIVIGQVAREQVRLAGSLLSATVRPSINDGALEPLRVKVEAINATVGDDDEGEEEVAVAAGDP
jgi:hypothetical protein